MENLPDKFKFSLRGVIYNCKKNSDEWDVLNDNGKITDWCIDTVRRIINGENHEFVLVKDKWDKLTERMLNA